jgi:hypothetical protein
MSFLAPVFLYIGIGVAAAALALHFIVTRQPASSVLPTVRFVPASTVRVTTVAAPEDLLLLLLRMLVALLIGAAFARPVLLPRRRPVARIVVADVSQAVARIAEVRDSARTLLAPGDALVIADSTATVMRSGVAAAVDRLERAGRAGRLSPALIAARRTAAELRAGADSIELAIVSPLRRAEVDGATAAIRALWPGRIRLVPVAARADSLAPPAGLSVRGTSDDGVALAAALAGLPAGDSAVRIIRGVATPADSQWAAGGSRLLVRWPADGAPPGWVARARPDTSGAVIAAEAALVTPLERRWELPRTAHPRRIPARWVDGAPAAADYGVGAGCIRDVAVPVPLRGDLVLRPAFGRLVRALAAPCGTESVGPGLGALELSALAGSGPLAPREAIAPPDHIATPLVPWLLGAALALALLELLVRRGSAPAWSEAAPESPEPGAAAA